LSQGRATAHHPEADGFRRYRLPLKAIETVHPAGESCGIFSRRIE